MRNATQVYSSIEFKNLLGVKIPKVIIEETSV
jgi:hypothetical protein